MFRLQCVIVVFPDNTHFFIFKKSAFFISIVSFCVDNADKLSKIKTASLLSSNSFVKNGQILFSRFKARLAP